MKILCLFFVSAFIGACQPYLIVTAGTFPVSEKYTNADKASNKIVSVQQFPGRIKRSELFKFNRFTNDTVQAYHTNKELSLFVNACYDKKMKCGYLISASKSDTSRMLSYECTLFEVAEGKLETSTYHLESAVANFSEAKTYLTDENLMLFGGRVGTKKEMSRSLRKLKREAKMK